MNAPGEQLILRLIDTVQQSIGGIFAPWQSKRIGLAAALVRRQELLMLAQAELDAIDIRAGRKRLDEHGRLFEVPMPPDAKAINYSFPSGSQVLNSLESPATPGGLISDTTKAPESLQNERISDVCAANSESQTSNQDLFLTSGKFILREAEELQQRELGDKALSSIRLKKALLFAAEALENSTLPLPDKRVDDDWMERWRIGAQTVSKEQIQQIWGRVLAGEVCNPGSIHPRTLAFLSSLTTEDAKFLEQVAPFVVFRNYLARHLVGHMGNLALKDIVRLEGMGLLTQAETKTLEAKISLENHPAIAWAMHDAIFITRKMEGGPSSFQFPAYPLTDVGEQFFSIGDFKVNRPYLEAVASSIRASRFDVSIHYPADMTDQAADSAGATGQVAGHVDPESP